MATPEYVKRANNAYNAKLDIIQLKLPKGTKNRIKAATQDSYNEYIKRLVLADLDRLEQNSQPEAADAATDEQEQEREKAPTRTETPEEEAARLADLQAVLEGARAAQAHREEEQRQRKEAEEAQKAAAYRHTLTERIEAIKAAREAAAEDSQGTQ